MTVHATDPERILEAYADATRLVASPQLTARFQAAVATERASRRSRLTSLLPAWPFGRHLTFALRLQSLAFVLLTVLALGAVGGGAGAVLVSVVRQPGQTTDLPGLPALPAPSVVPAPSAVPPPSSAPIMPPARSSRAVPEPSPRVRVLAQRVPRDRSARADSRDTRAGSRDTRAGRTDRRARPRPVVVLTICRVAHQPVITSTRSCPF